MVNQNFIDQENIGKECICPQPGEVALPGCPAHLVYIDEFDNYQIRRRTCDHTWMVTEWAAVYEYDVESGKTLKLYLTMKHKFKQNNQNEENYFLTLDI